MTRAGSRLSSGFTLLEVILALGLMTMILAALYQALATHTRATQLVEADVRRVSRSRALLHRIAADLRAVAVQQADHWNSGNRPAPEGAIRLLQTDPAVIARSEPAAATGFSEPLAWRPGVDDADRGRSPPEGSESAASSAGTFGGFSLLGTSDRLLLRINSWEEAMDGSGAAIPDATAADAIDSPTDRTGSAAGGLSRRLLRRPAIRQVLYVFKRPQVVASSPGTYRPSADSAAMPEGVEESAGMNRQIDPRFADGSEVERPGPVYRQVATLPFGNETWNRLEADFVEFLSPERGEGTEQAANSDSTAGFERAVIRRDQPADAGRALASAPLNLAGEINSRGNGDATPLGSVLTEELADLRLRYFDGMAWRDHWNRADRLPHAVEISVRFIDDPSPSDDEEDSIALVGPPTFDDLEPPSVQQPPSRQRRRWFSGRLVVSLTPAARAPEFETSDGTDPGSGISEEAP